jgi:pyrroline-5-carboxylate reductase
MARTRVLPSFGEGLQTLRETHSEARLYLSMTFGFLGFGKMASALVQGMLQAGACKPEQILVVNRHPETIKKEVQQYGISLASSPKRLVQQADTIVLGTKPADSVQLLRDIRQDLDGKLLISVAVGITLQTLQDAAGHRTRVIRAMPNTPSLVKKGATAYALGDHATAADAEVADKMFSAVGVVFRVRETALNAVTGLSGSGPAHVFIFVEALADGGVMMGLPREIAFELAIQTSTWSTATTRRACLTIRLAITSFRFQTCQCWPARPSDHDRL